MSRDIDTSKYKLVTPDKALVFTDSDIWDDIEDITMKVDIGVESSGHDIAGILYNKSDNSPVGASWYHHENNEFSFHIAVVPDHQSQGLGRVLLDKVLDIYNVLKSKNPSLEMDVHVINSKLTNALYRRGFSCYDSYADGDEKYEKLTDAPSLSELYEDAKCESLSQVLEALNKGATNAGLSVEDYSLHFDEWFSNPGPISELLFDSFYETISMMPLEEHDIIFLHENIRLHNEKQPCYTVEKAQPVIENNGENKPNPTEPTYDSRRTRHAP